MFRKFIRNLIFRIRIFIFRKLTINHIVFVILMASIFSLFFFIIYKIWCLCYYYYLCIYNNLFLSTTDKFINVFAAFTSIYCFLLAIFRPFLVLGIFNVFIDFFSRHTVFFLIITLIYLFLNNYLF